MGALSIPYIDKIHTASLKTTEQIIFQPMLKGILNLAQTQYADKQSAFVDIRDPGDNPGSGAGFRSSESKQVSNK